MPGAGLVDDLSYDQRHSSAERIDVRDVNLNTSQCSGPGHVLTASQAENRQAHMPANPSPGP